MTEHANQPLHDNANDSGAAGASHSASNAGSSSGKDAHDERSTGRIVAALEAVLVDFARLMEGRSREDLRKPAQDGGWGVVEILPHILDWEEITRDRVWRILEEDRPELEEYDDTLWAIEHEYGSKDPHQVFRRITELRQQLVERLRELDEADWQRTGVLSDRGEVTIQWLMENLVRHDAKHLAQARDVIG
jgi:hypothetical protein